MAAPKYRPEIDGLRAIAVLSVVLFHADRDLMPGGFVGVDVFFVISGYLITSILASDWQRTGRLDLASFYARRVRRLLPALVAMVLLVMGAAVILLGRHGDVFEQTGQSAVAALVFLANFYFQANSGGYFDAPNESMPLLHLWSLSVEEQFYLVYPLLLALLLKVVPGGVVRRLIALSVVSLLLAEFWVRIHPERAFYQMPARFWELALGGVLALLAVPAGRKVRDQWMVPLGVLVIALACVYTPRWGSFPGIGALPAVLGTLMVLWGVHIGATQGRVAGLLRSPPAVAVGLVSYSLYLWHWPLLAFDTNLSIEPTPTPWRLMLCVAALGLAWLSWRYVERPFRGNPLSNPRRDIACGIAVTGAAVAVALALAQLDRIPPDLKAISEFARNDRPAAMAECHFASNQEMEALKPRECWSRPSQEPTVALWGDSHAMAWHPFAVALAEKENSSLAVATMNGCLPEAVSGVGGELRKDEYCIRLNELLIHQMQTGSIETLVIALRWPLLSPGVDVPPGSLRTRLEGLDRALLRIGEAPRIVLLGPVPKLRFPAPACISLGWDARCEVGRADFDASTALVWRELKTLAAKHTNVELIDPTDFFCDGRRCPVMREGYALYWDDNHISASAARTFAERYLAEPSRYRRLPVPAAPPVHR